MPLFDAYLIVDWSANSQPKTGKDSIWWCLTERNGNQSHVARTLNPSTRTQAIAEIEQTLLQCVESGKRVLVGFDFAYGYPGGFAAHLGLPPETAWMSIWQELAARIVDDNNNDNNRFQVAACLNQRLSGISSPFWGCPQGRVNYYLDVRKPVEQHMCGLAEFRIAERNVGAHSTWKLFYNGSVGSQALLGIPRLYQLRFRSPFSEVSCVWPFETGLKPLGADDIAGKSIVHAEVYPSMLRISPTAGQVKDKVQVCALGKHFAALDQADQLAGLFAGDSDMSEDERRRVEREEGWILGVTSPLLRGKLSARPYSISSARRSGACF